MENRVIERDSKKRSAKTRQIQDFTNNSRMRHVQSHLKFHTKIIKACAYDKL